MALVVGVGGGGFRLTLSRWVQQLLGLRSRRQSRGRGSPSKSRTRGEEDDTLPLIKRATSAYSSTPVPLGDYDSSPSRAWERMFPPFEHVTRPARNLFDQGTAQLEDVAGSLEMAISIPQARLPPRAHVPAPAAVVGATRGQAFTVHIPDGLLASLRAPQQGVQVDRTSGASITANGALVPVSSVSKRGPPEWMKVFKGLLLAHVFFALPLLVIFFPRYEKEKSKTNLLFSLFDRSEVGIEKIIVLTFFVIYASVGSLGVLLAHIAFGPKCMGIVGCLTLWTIISGVGFVDYMFLKTLPEELISKIIFLVHFLVMAIVILVLWAKFVGCSQCCGSEEDLRHEAPV